MTAGGGDAGGGGLPDHMASGGTCTADMLCEDIEGLQQLGAPDCMGGVGGEGLGILPGCLCGVLVIR